MQDQSQGTLNTGPLLSYPVPSTSRQPSPPPIAQPRPLLKDRLYVGNLHPTVDEYTLLQVFAKYGTISKLDFLFHKAGPYKGKPRGYAFVEYSNPDDAEKALHAANDKLLRGRKLVVTQAHQAPEDQMANAPTRHKRFMNDTGKPTTLSLLKSVSAGRSDATEDKIAKMEAKLRQLEQPSSSLVGHPSLPPKPIVLPSSFDSVAASAGSTKPQHVRTSMPLPSLPLAPTVQRHPLPERPALALATSMSTSASTSASAPSHLLRPPRKATPSLLGVKIKKHRES